MRVLIIDDHPATREGLKTILKGLDPSVEVFDAGSVSDAREAIPADTGIELVLLDMGLPGTSHLEALHEVKQLYDGAAVVVFSADDDRQLILKAIEAGAAGYIPKHYDGKLTLLALRVVLAHRVYIPEEALASGPQHDGATAGSRPRFSSKQRLVLGRLLQGKSNKLIARELKMAEGTVKAHLWAAYQALGVRSRTEAMYRVHELGILQELTRSGEADDDG